MIEQNFNYISQVKIKEIPWHRLTTPYDRATNFPDLFDLISSNDADTVDTIADLIEHQSTLWHCTPFALIFMCRFLKDNSINSEVKTEILYALYLVASAIEETLEQFIMSDDDHLTIFSDMLLEKYLWSEDYNEEDDFIRYEEDPFAPELFCSFYYFSLEVLMFNSNVFIQLEKSLDPQISEFAIKINKAIGLKQTNN